MTEYTLKIDTRKKNYSEITRILQIVPSSIEYFWEFAINEDNDLYVRAIDYFMDLIESNIQKLKKSGIEADDIVIWFYKPYTNECNIEFSPNEMRRLAENGITLCISCWETSEPDSADL